MDDQLLTRLRADARARPEGEFHFPELYGPEWDNLAIGEKVRLGHAFLDAVRDGALPTVEDTGRKAGGGRVYRRV